LPHDYGKRYKYEIVVRPSPQGYFLILKKNFGDHYGMACHVKTKEEALKEIRCMLRKWGEFDYILNSLPEKPSMNNLRFESFTKDITKAEIFGITPLSAFQTKKASS